MTDSAFGAQTFAYGPGKLYWDTESGGDDLDLGGTDQITITIGTTKIELRESQAGDRAADKAVSAQMTTIACGLSRATLERLSKIWQGFTLETDTAGDPQRFFFSSVLAQRDSSIWKQMTFNNIVDGILSVDPFDIIDFWRVAPSTESTELVYDAVTQRYFGLTFECYEDETQLDEEGRATYFASRAE